MDTCKNTSAKLLVRSVIRDDENLNAYRIRIALENGLDSPLWAFGRMGQTYERCLESILRISEVTGQPYDLLLSRSYIELIKHISHVSWFNHIVSSEMIRKSSPLCPICLEQGSMRCVWDLKLVVACPYHDCWLVDRCPSCKVPIRWDTMRSNQCRCGYLLENFEFLEEASPAAIAIAAIVEKSLGSVEEGLINKAKAIPETFSDLPISIFTEFYNEFSFKSMSFKKVPFGLYPNAASKDFRFEMAASDYFGNQFLSWPKGVVDAYGGNIPNERRRYSGWRDFAKRLMKFPGVTHGLIADGLSLSTMLSFTTKHYALPENRALTRSSNEDETFRAIYNMLNKYRVQDVAWG